MAKVENCRVNGKEFHTQETSSGTKQSLRRKISQVKKKINVITLKISEVLHLIFLIKKMY